METIHIAYTSLFTKRKDFFAKIFNSRYFDENLFPFNSFGEENINDSETRNLK